MGKSTKLSVAITALLVLASFNLFAQLETTLDLAPAGYRDPKSSGGEFTAYLSGNSTLQNYILDNYNSNAKDGNGFETFCVEIDEDFKPGDTYSTSIGNDILPGGASVTIGTAYLYSQFAQGTLQGYTYSSSGTGREYTADELQDAIWYLQGEITSAGDQYTTASHLLYKFGGTSFNPASDPFVELVENLYGANAFSSDANDNYGVQVLELTVSGQPAQDQLVYCPVPEPGTFAAGAILLLPLGWSVLQLIRKKKLSPQFVANPVPEPLKTDNWENLRKHPGPSSGPKSIY